MEQFSSGFEKLLKAVMVGLKLGVVSLWLLRNQCFMCPELLQIHFEQKK